MDLDELYKQINEDMPYFSFDGIANVLNENYGILASMKSQDEGKNYYRALAQLVRSLGVKRALDLGSYQGISAYSMAAGGAKVDSYDLTLKYVSGATREKASKIGCNFFECQTEEDILELDFSAYDFIFVDIDHNGKVELEVHKRIQKSGFKGVVLYDDVLLNPMMIDFWYEKIKNPKCLTMWHFSGQGMVYYGGNDGSKEGEKKELWKSEKN